MFEACLVSYSAGGESDARLDSMRALLLGESIVYADAVREAILHFVQTNQVKKEKWEEKIKAMKELHDALTDNLPLWSITAFSQINDAIPKKMRTCHIFERVHNRNEARKALQAKVRSLKKLSSWISIVMIPHRILSAAAYEELALCLDTNLESSIMRVSSEHRYLLNIWTIGPLPVTGK
jgi:hypothetical protein